MLHEILHQIILYYQQFMVYSHEQSFFDKEGLVRKTVQVNGKFYMPHFLRQNMVKLIWETKIVWVNIKFAIEYVSKM